MLRALLSSRAPQELLTVPGEARRPPSAGPQRSLTLGTHAFAPSLGARRLRPQRQMDGTFMVAASAGLFLLVSTRGLTLTAAM
jgi:hypothetical protein